MHCRSLKAFGGGTNVRCILLGLVLGLNLGLTWLLVTLIPAHTVLEAMRKLQEEVNGIMHEELNAQLGNVALTGGAEGGSDAQMVDTGQGSVIGQVRIYPPY